MKESLEKAKEELKRIDHLVYVTLKYTRTVDVLISVIKRMISSYEYTIDALLLMAKKQGKIEEIPEIPLLKAQKAREVYTQKPIQDHIDRYILFRKLVRSNYERKSEYRRHVTMTALVDGKVVDIDIDNITEIYHSMKEFVELVNRLSKKND